ncbi:MAG: hypothetical protein WBP94_07135 [Rhodomicrobiaceae bacterium]
MPFQQLARGDNLVLLSQYQRVQKMISVGSKIAPREPRQEHHGPIGTLIEQRRRRGETQYGGVAGTGTQRFLGQRQKIRRLVAVAEGIGYPADPPVAVSRRTKGQHDLVPG